jgi:hypothetical protein
MDKVIRRPFAGKAGGLVAASFLSLQMVWRKKKRAQKSKTGNPTGRG